MSYEGYEMFLCEKGHKTCMDAGYFLYTEEGDTDSAELNICHVPNCGSIFVWSQSIDQTNGYDESYPHSFERELEILAYEDVENHDHYGNVYYTRIPIYAVPEDGTGEGCKIKK